MESIFPGLGVNPFNTKPLVDYFNIGRKAESAAPPRPAGDNPAEKTASSQNKAALPGRGSRIDYIA
jgi:hypothetical protein